MKNNIANTLTTKEGMGIGHQGENGVIIEVQINDR